MIQMHVTPAMSKRLIGKGMAVHPSVLSVLEKGKLVVIAGTTNGYVAEEVLKSLGQANGFSRVGFRRGMVTPPGFTPPEREFPGDVVIVDGVWQKGMTIFDAVEDLREGDLVLKGGNALGPDGQAGVFVASEKGGTILAAVTAVLGRRVQLIVPIGIEKRVFEDVNTLARRVNSPGVQGVRLFPMPGETFTELDSLRLLTGAKVHLQGAGGVYGAEGAIWLGISGLDDQVQASKDLIQSVHNEPMCEV